MLPIILRETSKLPIPLTEPPSEEEELWYRAKRKIKAISRGQWTWMDLSKGCVEAIIKFPSCSHDSSDEEGDPSWVG